MRGWRREPLGLFLHISPSTHLGYPLLLGACCYHPTSQPPSFFLLWVQECTIEGREQVQHKEELGEPIITQHTHVVAN